MNQSFKVLLILIVIFFTTHACWANSASTDIVSVDSLTQPHNGIVGDKNKYSFNLSNHQAMLVRVTQPNSDIKVQVSQYFQGTKTIFESSLPATQWFDELVLITTDDCNRCLMSILPVSKVDETGSYQVFFELIDDTEVDNRVVALRAFTAATKQWLSSKNESKLLDIVASTFITAKNLAHQSNQSSLAAKSEFLAAFVYHLASKYEQQDIIFESLFTRSDTVPPSILMHLFYETARNDIDNGHYEKASELIEKAMKIATAQKHSSMQAQLNASKATILIEQGRYSEGIAIYEQVNATHLASGNWTLATKGMMYIGWFQYNKGELEKASLNYQKALSFATKMQIKDVLVDVNTKLGSLYRQSGNVELANMYIDRALKTSPEIPHSLLDGWAKQAKARVYLDTGMFELAQDMFEQAKLSFKKVGSITDAVNIDYFLGTVHLKLNNFDTAKVFLERVLEHDLSTQNHYDIGVGYNRLATSSMALKEYKQALIFQNLALQYLESTDDSYLKAQALSQAAEIELLNQNILRSEQLLQQAIPIQSKNSDTYGLISSQLVKAKLMVEKGDTDQSLELLEAITSTITKQRELISRHDLQQGFIALHQEIIHLQIQLLQQSGANPEDILLLSESFRTLTLKDKIAWFDPSANYPQKLMQQRQTLEDKLLKNVIDYQVLTTTKQRLALDKQTRQIAAQIFATDAAINQQKKSKSPHPKTKDDPFSIRQLQSKLDNNTLVLYFDIGVKDSHLWMLTNERVSYNVLPSADQLATQVFQITELLRKTNRPSSITTHIKKLSDQLFSSNEIQLDLYTNIVVIPSGPINYLPFSILHSANSDTQLIHSTNISFAPSLSILTKLQQRSIATKNQHDLLIIAAPDMLSIPSTNKPSVATHNGFHMSELPYANAEAASIQRIVAGDVKTLLGADASKKKVLQYPLTSFKTLHFATHAISHHSQPMLSGLVLSNLSSNKNLLLAPEIGRLNLDAELIVLSGCETGIGQLIKGEGLQGLSRAFFEAGAKRVIASLWSVQDDATAALMSEFYRNVYQQHLPIEQALRLAKLYVRNFQRKNGQRPWKEPFYWAGFTLQGPGGLFKHAEI